ncbi:MAG: hypothetical protein RR310_02770 [Eubacterium sp.]
MENIQNSWIISDTMDTDLAESSKRPTRSVKTMRAASRRRKKPIKNIQKTNMASRRKPRRKTKHLTGVSCFIMAAIAFFIVATGLLFQQLIITELDGEVRTMQVALADQQKINDSKEGQLVSNDEFQNIEATARSYGMAEASANQYVFETTMDTQRASIDQNESQSWIRSILK